MKAALAEVMREFYELGIPEDVKARDVVYLEKAHSATVVSSKLLSSEIATEMRGRSLDIEVFPLSFAEYLRFNGLMADVPKPPFTSRTAGALRHAMARYFEEGGFPDVQWMRVTRSRFPIPRL